MSEDPGELQRFFAETIEPLAAYDDQYETELVATVEAYLGNDGNVAADRRNSSSPTATRSATGSSACASSAATTSPPPRVARSSASASRRCASSASPPPAGPAQEPGAEGGKVPRSSEE